MILFKGTGTGTPAPPALAHSCTALPHGLCDNRHVTRVSLQKIAVFYNNNTLKVSRLN